MPRYIRISEICRQKKISKNHLLELLYDAKIELLAFIRECLMREVRTKDVATSQDVEIKDEFMSIPREALNIIHIGVLPVKVSFFESNSVLNIKFFPIKNGRETTIELDKLSLYINKNNYEELLHDINVSRSLDNYDKDLPIEKGLKYTGRGKFKSEFDPVLQMDAESYARKTFANEKRHPKKMEVAIHLMDDINKSYQTHVFMPLGHTSIMRRIKVTWGKRGTSLA